MHRILSCLSLLAVVSCAKKAPSPAAVSERVEAAVVDRELLLWRVSDGDAVSHLLGTCHLPIPLESFFPDTTPLDTSRKLYVEIDMSQLDVVEMLPLIWDDEVSQREQLGRARFAQITRMLGSDMPAPMVDHMPDWVLYSVLLYKSIPMDSGSSESNNQNKNKNKNKNKTSSLGSLGQAVDVLITQRAVDQGVEVAHIETMAQQAEIMNRINWQETDPLDEQQAYAQRAMDGLMQICLRGDLSFAEELSKHSEVNAILLEERNRAWYPILAPELAEGGVFIAVGAAHMFGPTGLIAQAESDGYTVERLSGAVVELPIPETPAPAEQPSDSLVPEEMSARMADSFASKLCTPEGPVRTCLAPDAQRCEERIRADVHLCVDQFVTEPSDLKTLLTLVSHRLALLIY